MYFLLDPTRILVFDPLWLPFIYNDGKSMYEVEERLNFIFFVYKYEYSSISGRKLVFSYPLDASMVIYIIKVMTPKILYTCDMVGRCF